MVNLFSPKGPLITDHSLFPYFLIFHSLGYLFCYMLYSKILTKKAFTISLLLTMLLTSLFPHISLMSKKIIISCLALISPIWILYSFLTLKKEKGNLWQYTGLISGNFITDLLSSTSILSPQAMHRILAVALLSLYFINIKIQTQETPFQNLEINRANQFYLYAGIFIFYLISPLIYNWLTITHTLFHGNIQFNIFFYSFEILFAISYLKLSCWSYKELFILTTTLISLGNIALHFEKLTTFYLGKLLFFSGTGIMDLITLFLFINFFNTLKPLALLYGLISLSILCGNLLFEFLQTQRET